MGDSNSKKPMDKLKTSVLSRGLSLAKLSLSTGVKAAQIALKKSSNGENLQQFVSAVIQEQAAKLTKELGSLKGSAMKIGQMLSVYGEYFFPPEVNAVLKTLQFNSPPLAWEAIYKVIRKEFSPEQLAQLEIETTALASASIGQVHKAQIKKTKEWLALKIQYPGVAGAIDSDINMLKSILKMTPILPKDFDLTPVMEEVKEMFTQEVKYDQELKFAREYQRNFAEDARYLIPRAYPEFCTSLILAYELVDGLTVDSEKIKNLSQVRRNILGENFIEHYLQELFVHRLVQTDPHMGNYRIILKDSPQKDQWVLLDFGACRRLSEDFVEMYKKLIRAAIDYDEEGVLTAGQELQFVKYNDPPKLKKLFAQFCFLMVEPYLDPADSRVRRHLMDTEGNYDWVQSDLPEQLIKLALEIKNEFSYRTPPREVIFLDRKTVGVFMMMKALRVKFKARTIISRFL